MRAPTDNLDERRSLVGPLSGLKFMWMLSRVAYNIMILNHTVRDMGHQHPCTGDIWPSLSN